MVQPLRRRARAGLRHRPRAPPRGRVLPQRLGALLRESRDHGARAGSRGGGDLGARVRRGMGGGAAPARPAQVRLLLRPQADLLGGDPGGAPPARPGLGDAPDSSRGGARAAVVDAPAPRPPRAAPVPRGLPGGGGPAGSVRSGGVRSTRRSSSPSASALGAPVPPPAPARTARSRSRRSCSAPRCGWRATATWSGRAATSCGSAGVAFADEIGDEVRRIATVRDLALRELETVGAEA